MIKINKYCGTLFIAMIILFLIGLGMALSNNYWGMIPFGLAGLMASGFTTLKSSPREVGVIALFGSRTETMVDGKGVLGGLVLLFKPWFFNVVDIIRFEIVQTDYTIPITSLKCQNNAVVTGTVSIAFKPNDISAEQLSKFDDAGRVEGIKQQLNEMIIANLQEKIKNLPVDEVVGNTSTLGTDLAKSLNGTNGNSSDTNHYDDISGLGIIITKLQPKLEKDKKAVEADQRVQQTKAMNTRIENRKAYLITNGSLSEEDSKKSATIDKIRKQLLTEDLHNDKQVKVVRGGGMNVNDTRGEQGGGNT
ncbi:MAG: SPFH domain-containing protein [Patescibacteria group bacterium]